jgi:hypothetical protein
MAASQWKWEGLMELRRELRTMPERLTGRAFDIVRRHTENTYVELMRRYARKSGNLQRGVTSQTSRTQFAVTGWVKSRAPHAWIYEKGTKTRTTTGARSVRAGAVRGRMPRTNILIPTAMRERNLMYDEFAEMLRREGLTVRAA